MEHELITGRKNPTVVSVAALREKKYRDRSGLFFAEGTVLLSEALLSGVIPRRVFVTENMRSRLPELPPSAEIIPVTRSVYEKLSVEDAPEGILSVFGFLPEASSFSGGVLILENLQDPGNVGSIVRSAAALGISGVILVGCADLYNPKTVRATMGALFRMPFRCFDDVAPAARALRETGHRLYAAALDEGAKRLDQVRLEKKCAVMIGNEGHGLSEKAKNLCDETLIIPMAGMESLNAAAAAAVFLWEMREKKADTEKNDV